MYMLCTIVYVLLGSFKHGYVLFSFFYCEFNLNNSVLDHDPFDQCVVAQTKVSVCVRILERGVVALAFFALIGSVHFDG